MPGLRRSIALQQLFGVTMLRLPGPRLHNAGGPILFMVRPAAQKSNATRGKQCCSPGTLHRDACCRMSSASLVCWWSPALVQVSLTSLLQQRLVIQHGEIAEC